jgi:beta-lactamase class C
LIILKITNPFFVLPYSGMRLIGFTVFLTALIFCTSCLNVSFSTHSIEMGDKSPAVDTLAQVLDEYIQGQMDSCDCIGAAITLITGHKTRLLKGYGYRSLEDSIPVDIHTVFRLASVSKHMAALLAASQVEKKRLSYTDAVCQYIPEFSIRPIEYTEQVTLHHLLSHSIGLPYHSYTNLVEEGYSIQELIPLFSELTIPIAPGMEYAYQNASFALIEPILEKQSHLDFSTLFRETFTRPLGMQSTTTSLEAMTANPNHALPYAFHRDCQCPMADEVSDKYYNTISAGGINTSIHDLNKWLYLLLGYRPELISPEAMRAYLEPQVKTSQDRRYYNFWPGVEATYYAHGLRVLDRGDHYLYYHGGYANQYRSEIVFDPKNKFALAAMFNSTCRLSEILIPAILEKYPDLRFE